MQEHIENFQELYQLCKYAQNTTIDRKTSEYFDLTIWDNNKENIISEIRIYDGGAIRICGHGTKKIGYDKCWQIIRNLVLE